MNRCYIDTEVKSDANLKLVGAAKYFEHPSTHTFVVTYQLEPMVGTRALDLTLDSTIPEDLVEAAADPEVIFWAFNAPFDMQALENLGIYVPIERWRCLMVKALSLGFSGGLDAVLERVGVPYQKERDGARLIRKFCMPQPVNRKIQNWDRHNAPEDWAKFIQYGVTDTDVLIPLYEALSQYRNNVNWKEWATDQRINRRGIPIDLGLVDKALITAEEEKDSILRRMVEISGLDNPNSKAQVKTWLRDVEGINLANMQKATVALALTNPSLSDAAREMLILNQQISKTSTAKWNTLDRATCNDGRIRYAHQYIGAARTGRDAHRVFQPGNIPRGTLKNAASASDLLMSHGREGIDLVYGNVMEVLSSTIRCAITAPDGQTLAVSDLTGIEGRVLPWLCGFQTKLDQIAAGLDMYKVAAEDALGVPYARVTKEDRFKGKVCLGAHTKVVTSNGVKDLIDVYSEDLLWDGKEFVSHDGVIFNGLKETIKWKGIEATPDHKVLASSGWHTVSDALKSETISQSVLALGSLPSSDTSRNLNAIDTGISLLQVGIQEFDVTAGENILQKTALFLKPVYDIVNAGSRHRFTILTEDGEPAIVANCELALGYQGGPNALNSMAVSLGRETYNDAEGLIIVRGWRAKNKPIVKYWYACQKAVEKAIMDPGAVIKVMHVSFVVEGEFLFINLPSGRRLAYHLPEYGPDGFSYMGMNSYTHKWERVLSYGGKIVENCLAEGTQVLTDRGWVAIEDIRLSDKIHDGLEFVNHRGKIFKSVQTCVSIDGVYMTPDHEVLTDEGWKAARKTERPYRPDLRHVEGATPNNIKRKETALDVPLQMRGVGREDRNRRIQRCKKGRHPELWVLNWPLNWVCEFYSRYEQAPRLLGLAKYVRQMQAAFTSGLEELRRKRDIRMFALGNFVQSFLGGHGPRISFGAYVREAEQLFRILPRELCLANTQSAGKQQERKHAYKHAEWPNDCLTSFTGIQNRCDNSSIPNIKRLARREATNKTRREKQGRVYDILNCGPRNRFVVRGKNFPFIVHNCTQAVARDIFFYGIKLYEQAGGKIVLRVHDEIVAPVGTDDAEEQLALMIKCMTAVPDWAEGLPLNAEGFLSKRYKK